MGTRRVRTSAGVQRFDKPIGAIIGRTSGGVSLSRTVNRVENLPTRKAGTRAQRAQRVRADVKSVQDLYARAERGEKLRGDERGRVEYQSPAKRREAKATRGTVLRPRSESLALARGRRDAASARREVAYNPLAGRLVAVRGERGTRASAARAKARKAPKVTEYVGRRRAKD